MGEQDMLPIAVQLYTLRTLTGGFDDTLAQVAAAGYTAVETVGDHGLTANDLVALLAKHDLQVIATHLPLDTLRDQISETIAFNRAIGNDTVVVPYIPILRDARDGTIYRETGRVLGELARAYHAEGVQLLYHNHSWELKVFDGQLALDLLFEAAGPELGFEPDVAWIAAGGLDPAELLQRYAGRCPRVHIKDLAPVGKRPEDAFFDGHVLADVGAGVLDWPALISTAQAAGAAWLIVEHDNSHDPVASIARSLAYLRGLRK
jgi:sugar phosphate isomerase/epimerase